MGRIRGDLQLWVMTCGGSLSFVDEGSGESFGWSSASWTKVLGRALIREGAGILI